MTNEERKFGGKVGLESINKSFKKLSALKDRNWSQRDINANIYKSKSNFEGFYNASLNTEFNNLQSGN